MKYVRGERERSEERSSIDDNEAETEESAASRPPDRRFTRWLLGLGAIQARRPAIPLAICAILTVLGLLLAARLQLRTSLDQLLPESQPSVQELRRVASRTDGVSNLFVVLEGDDPQALRDLGDSLVPKLQAIGAPWVGSSADGVHDARSFLQERAGLFASVEELEELRDDLQARWDWEVGKALGTNLLDEEEDDPEPIAAEDRIRELAGSKAELVDRYPDGYFQSKDGKALVVAVRTAIPAGDLEDSQEVRSRVSAVVEEARASSAAFDEIRIGYTGDLVTSMEEYEAVRADLVQVGALGLGLVLGAVLLYYLRFRTLIALAITVTAGCAWTFGVTKLAIGHLNVATGFLVSIVAGNGINFGIIYMARYLEARRADASVTEAIATAHRETWLPTITAALAAGAAYGSLIVTDFRGFKHFALIGGVGMLLCWIATYALLPAVLVVIEKLRPFANGGSRKGFLERLRHGGTRYDAPFVFLIRRFPRMVAVVGMALTLAGSVLVIKYVWTDPIEYDMKRIRNDVRQRAERMRLSSLAGELVGQTTTDGMAILVDRLDQVGPLVETLQARRDQAPQGEKPFEAVHTVFDFIPEAQEEKLPILGDIRDLVLRARERGAVSDADWERIAPMLPPAGLGAFDVDDLPTDLARPFTERDGTRGRIVYISPTEGESTDDAKYLIRWADAFRSTTLPNGEVILGSGRAVIYADMLRTVVDDAPKAIFLSLGGTALVVLLAFRKRARAAVVIVALLVGVAWLCGIFALLGLKLNFLNFIALPITFGIGVDYAVNIVERYGEGLRRGRGVLSMMKTTGGAVVLCSLTTILGYVALLGSLNQAVRSLGTAAVLGEICCLLAAVLFLPAAARLREQRRARQLES